MAVKLRLARAGSKGRPFYYVVAASSRSPRDGRFLQKMGWYNPLLPKDSPERVKIDDEKVKHWLSVGAQPTEVVKRLLKISGIAVA